MYIHKILVCCIVLHFMDKLLCFFFFFFPPEHLQPAFESQFEHRGNLQGCRKQKHCGPGSPGCGSIDFVVISLFCKSVRHFFSRTLYNKQRIYLASFFNVQLLTGGKEKSKAGEEEENRRLQLQFGQDTPSLVIFLLCQSRSKRLFLKLIF